jgi:enoyl-CoA hydratase/carnithine racemase
MHTTYEEHGSIATLTFNRPEARNAMTWAMYDALAAACDRVDASPEIRVLVLRGAGGKAFVAGTDIAQFQTFTTPEHGVAYEDRLDSALDRLERVKKPTIAQVEGIAAGGGCAISLTCDLRVATPNASFGIPIARTLGNCLSGATYSRLVDGLGAARAKELLFTGRFIPADEALAIGLVNRIASSDSIGQVVTEYAETIAANAPLTLQATKEAVRRLLVQRRLSDGRDRDLIEMCYGSADFREGVAAFLSKRRPQWTGK